MVVQPMNSGVVWSWCWLAHDAMLVIVVIMMPKYPDGMDAVCDVDENWICGKDSSRMVFINHQYLFLHRWHFYDSAFKIFVHPSIYPFYNHPHPFSPSVHHSLRIEIVQVEIPFRELNLPFEWRSAWFGNCLCQIMRHIAHSCSFKKKKLWEKTLTITN